MKSTLRILCLCLIAMVLAGCSGQALLDGAAKTTVTVTLDGAPVEEAAVVFTPEGGGRSAVGQTDAQGIAEMGTANYGDGVLPGRYKIVVVKSIDDPNTPAESTDPEDQHAYSGRGRPVYAKQIYLVPEKYINTSTSGLSATIQPEIENEVTLELTSK